MPRLPFLFSLAALIFALLVALVGRPSGPSINPFYDPGTGKSTHILLLTAHPDDECMFFAPTVLGLATAVPGTSSLESPPDIFSLCLSVGNADGLGNIRRDELGRSLDVLGVPDDRRWVENRR